MGNIEKTVGKFHISISEPSPRWVRIKINAWNGQSEVTETGILNIEDLHDLRYAIDRILVDQEFQDRPRNK